MAIADGADSVRKVVREELRQGADQIKIMVSGGVASTRAVSQGVRTIEHGNLIDTAAAQLMAERGAYLVANLVAYFVMKERAAQFGMNADKLEKNELVLRGALESLEICRKAAVKVGFGSDLLGQLQDEQSREFLLRAEVSPPIEIIRSATTIGAEIIRMQGKVGIIEAGAFADLLVVDGNPLRDLGLFQDQGAHLSVIMKDGRFHKHRLT